MPTDMPRFRFAPSPNGPLHRGHAMSALLNATLARRYSGHFLLRIEDIDLGRTNEVHIKSIERDLDWLGLKWPKPPRRQSEHMGDYARAFRALERDGLIYPCFCSRSDIREAVAARRDVESWPCDPDGAPVYPGTCRTLSQNDIARHLQSGLIPQGRLKMDRALAQLGALSYRQFDPLTGHENHIACDGAQWGDVVLVRKDTPTSYHLAVVVDDALQGITHVVRGKDLAPATTIHTVLQRLLRLPVPSYWHHDLLLDDDGQKLAKSRQSKSLREAIDAGLTRDALIGDFCRNLIFRALLDFENKQPERC